MAPVLNHNKAILSTEPEIQELLEKGVVSEKAIWSFICKLTPEQQKWLYSQLDVNGHYTLDQVKQLTAERDEAKRVAAQAEEDKQKAISDAIPPRGYVEAVYLRYFNGIDSTILAEKSKLTSNRQIRMDSNDSD